MAHAPEAEESSSDEENKSMMDEDDDELLYDREGDEADEAWVKEHLIGAQEGFSTDATLDCPKCFARVCLCCQQHEMYWNQFRALFVVNCLVSKESKWAYDESAENHLRKWKDGDGEALRLVRCRMCKEVLGVKDEDDVFHFFNVFAVPPRGLTSGAD